MREQFEAIVPDGQHLAMSRDADGAVRGLLFDDKTNRLVGQANLYPIDGRNNQPIPSQRPASAATRQLSAAERQVIEQLATLAAEGIILGVKWASPKVKKWWIDTAAPALKARWVRVQAPRETTKDAQLETVVPQTPAESGPPSRELELAEPKFTMSREEWDERLRAMIAAGRFLDEQRGLLANAIIDTQKSEVEADTKAPELTPAQFARELQAVFEANPSLLTEETAAEFIRVFRGGSAPEDDQGNLAIQA